MTQDEITRMARESGFWTEERPRWEKNGKKWVEWIGTNEELARFFNLAFAAGAAHEREACAKVCEETPIEFFATVSGQKQAQHNRNQIAAAIRARG